MQNIHEIFIIIKAKIQVQEGQTLEECMQDLQENGDYNIFSSEDTKVLDTEWIETSKERPSTILLEDLVEKPKTRLLEDVGEEEEEKEIILHQTMVVNYGIKLRMDR